MYMKRMRNFQRHLAFSREINNGNEDSREALAEISAAFPINLSSLFTTSKIFFPSHAGLVILLFERFPFVINFSDA